jgi:tetratricopeptide (TPR) repeat protein
MNKWLLRGLNLLLLALLVAAVPFGMKAYYPIDRNNKAVEALQNKQYDRAIELLSEAIEGNPDNAVFKRNLIAAYNSKAIDLEKGGQDFQALESYEKALTLDPGNQTIIRNCVSTLNNLAVAQSNAKEFVESQKLFEHAGKWLPKIDDAKVRDDVRRNYSALLTLWGAELMKRNQFDGSRMSFEQALGLDPKNAVANIYLGDLFYEVNQYDKAKQYYAAALPIDNENTDYLKNRLLMIEDESKVETLFREIRDPKGHFLVHHVEYANGVRVPEILAMLNEARDTVGGKLGIFPARAVNVKIYNTRDFYRISNLPEWAIGIFDGKLRLKLDDVQSAPSQVKDLLFHEYTHAVLAMNVKQRIPAWFHEGLAQLMEPQFAENPREQAQMREALARKRLSFDVLQESFKEITSKHDAEDAYLLSKYFLAFLNRKHGRDKMAEWVRHLANEEKFDDAFAAVYGSTLKTSQQDWMQSQAR